MSGDTAASSPRAFNRSEHPPAGINRPAGGSRRSNWVAIASGAFLMLVALATIVVPMLASSEWTDLDLSRRALEPGASSELGRHLLGTDGLGRDLLVRVFEAGRSSLLMSSLSLLLAVSFGTAVGVVAAYARGTVEAIIMRVVDVTMSFPTLLLAVVVVFVFGPSVPAIIIVLAASRWPIFARIARSEGLRVAQLDFVSAYRTAAYSPYRLIRDGFLPNIAAAVVTVGVLNFGQFLLAESSLSFLGLGVQPPSTSWGLMVSDGIEFTRSAWWIIAVPGLLIFGVSLAASVLADEVGRRIDPISGASSDVTG